jgi:hypothetical protein
LPGVRVRRAFTEERSMATLPFTVFYSPGYAGPGKAETVSRTRLAEVAALPLETVRAFAA